MDNASSSGFVVDSFEGVNDHFTSLKILESHGHNVLARAKRFGRWYLLKGLAPKESQQASYHEMLVKEFDIMMRLQHLGIVQTVGLEDVDGMGKCIVMEWVEGITLAEWLKGQHTREERQQVASQLMDALAHIHQHGVVHRDIKPSNIMITTNGQQVKIIDFGLADTDVHATLKQPAGTHSYMAPEQAQAGAPDVRNDIYSLGLVLEQLQLGQLYKNPIAHCLMPIDKRYQSIVQLKEDIERSKHRRRMMKVVGFAIGVSLVIAGILLGLGYVGRKKLEEPSGRFEFKDALGFVYTNWDNGYTLNVSVQYTGRGIKNVTLQQEQRFVNRSWKVSELGFGCFRNHSEIQNITIYSTIFGIQKNSFKGCTNLRSITMPNLMAVPGIGCGGWQTVIDSIFEPEHFENVTLYVPIVEEMKRDSSWCKFKHIEPLSK